MVVRVALVAVPGAMLVAVVMMPMIMPAAAGIAMRVSMGFRMAMGVLAMGLRRGVAMVMMRMAAMVVARMIAIGVVVVIGPALGLEWPVHGAHHAALAAHHLGQHMIVLDIDRVSRDLGRGVAVADVPGDAHQPQRVLGANLEQALRRRLDQHEPAVLQLDGVAVAERGGLVEIKQDAEAAIGRESEAAAVAVVMVECQRIDDAVWPDGGLANDGGGAKHDGTSVTEANQRRSIDRGSITSITGGAVTQALVASRNATVCGERKFRSMSARVSQLS